MLEPHAVNSRTRTPNRVGEATRVRIMRAALELISTRGIDDVSVRDITDAASASSGAINYHFGSKTGLIDELLRVQAADVTRRREQMLDRVAQDAKATLRQVAEVFVLPMLASQDELGAPGTSAAFLSAIAGHPDYADRLSQLYEAGNTRLLALLVSQTPHLTDEVRMIRWAMAKDLVNHAAANPLSPFNSFLRYMGLPRDVPMAVALTDVITAAFESPSSV